ncbi:uncharacterized protein ColSpa_07224 [Colletotrichum spaethianum]|uniref:Uncharacterized protein n=1 Tax=Colletotrichum spaethianum TaxID=700344 RepID=A0AA37LIA0_9PEZI|nr:uncharacterized protein ColSpa_07224 [Colletotrichum spaethianum]GKT47043.1 hypothetical protein ColSpa_07224 [Colletotrichum spaethianum]
MAVQGTYTINLCFVQAKGWGTAGTPATQSQTQHYGTPLHLVAVAFLFSHLDPWQRDAPLHSSSPLRKAPQPGGGGGSDDRIL